MATVEQLAKREELRQFAEALHAIDVTTGPAQTMLVGTDGRQVPIPGELFQVLEEAAKILALGEGISVLPHTAQLTTQEAADFLGMSRPTLVKLLESGAMPFVRVGRHRRVTLRDVVEYQARAQGERRASLAELAKDSIEHYGKLPKGVPSLKRLDDTEG